MAREAGKGSGRRPSEVSDEVIDENWSRIFGKKNTDAISSMKEDAATTPQPEEVYDPHLTINS